MTVIVNLSNGLVITPSFAPEHIEGVVAYYNEQQRIGFVKSWRIV